jgi:hypothetical protein
MKNSAKDIVIGYTVSVGIFVLPFAVAGGIKGIRILAKGTQAKVKKAIAQGKFKSWVKQSLKEGSLVKIDGILYEAEAGVVEKA